MHHFHLSSRLNKDGFVKRSRYLLFAIIATRDAYFVDVRLHPKRRGVEWVSQDLLRIVHSNWPQLIEANVLHGVRGSQLTDAQMHELRCKNVNYAMAIDGKAIAPLLGGLAGDGSSGLSTYIGQSAREGSAVPRGRPPQRRGLRCDHAGHAGPGGLTWHTPSNSSSSSLMT